MIDISDTEVGMCWKNKINTNADDHSSPGHQHPQYRMHNISGLVSSMRPVSTTYAISLPRNDSEGKYNLVYPVIKSAREGLLLRIFVLRYHILLIGRYFTATLNMDSLVISLVIICTVFPKKYTHSPRVVRVWYRPILWTLQWRHLSAMAFRTPKSGLFVQHLPQFDTRGINELCNTGPLWRKPLHKWLVIGKLFPCHDFFMVSLTVTWVPKKSYYCPNDHDTTAQNMSK